MWWPFKYIQGVIGGRQFCVARFCAGQFCAGRFCVGQFCVGQFCAGRLHAANIDFKRGHIGQQLDRVFLGTEIAIQQAAITTGLNLDTIHQMLMKNCLHLNRLPVIHQHPKGKTKADGEYQGFGDQCGSSPTNTPQADDSMVTSGHQGSPINSWPLNFQPYAGSRLAGRI